eukprot:Lithocolla_globosa_v1_NODE_6752_length_1040_cov_5.634518.p1 type:complete len:118 gc:universal NODE_6752_length_1040_cov_5.634518:833-480(-)
MKALFSRKCLLLLLVSLLVSTVSSMRPYHRDLRWRVVHAAINGGTYPQVAAVFHVCERSVGNWVRRFYATGDVDHHPHPGSPRFLSTSELNLLEEVVLDNRQCQEVIFSRGRGVAGN